MRNGCGWYFLLHCQDLQPQPARGATRCHALSNVYLFREAPAEEEPAHVHTWSLQPGQAASAGAALLEQLGLMASPPSHPLPRGGEF